VRRRIPLPSYTRKPGSPVHPFPYQVSMRAIEFLQAATFYPAFLDAVAGLYRDSNKDMMEKLRQLFVAGGMSQDNWEISVDCLTKYMQYLPSPVMQAAVVEGLSHWDWYVGKLGKFIEFARQHGPKPIMSSAMERKLPSVSLHSFSDQINVLEEASGNAIKITDAFINDVNEMVLVRNLGVHCQWEVTAHYLKSTKTIGWSIGDVREVSPSELEVWRDALYSIISDTSRHFAQMYAKVPDFDPYAPV
jgi:hypothetical protein